MPRPKISLCVIARDEEETLPRMIVSAREAVDEIVVVDTGSRDATARVARELGARVESRPFRDDFSEVRNAALDLAKGRWILVLDADEILAPGSAEAIRAAVRDDRLGGLYLPFRNELGAGRAHECALMRLFRNDPAVRFRYRIHEQVIPDLLAWCRRTGRRVATLESALVIHDGYVPDVYRSRGKAARNERLFRLQLRDHPEHAYSWYKFGDFLRRDPSRRAEAIEALERARTLLAKEPVDRRRDLAFAPEVFALLAVERDRDGDAEGALRLAAEGLSFGTSANLYYVLAHLHHRMGRYRESYGFYRRLRRLDPRTLAVPPEPGILGAGALLGMGLALAGRGRSLWAEALLSRALEEDPGLLRARTALARLRLDRGDASGAERLYREGLERHPDEEGLRLRLAALLDATGRGQEALAVCLEAAPPPAASRLAGELGVQRLRRFDLEGAFLAFLAGGADPTACAGREALGALARGETLEAAGEPARRILEALAEGRRYASRRAVRAS